LVTTSKKRHFTAWRCKCKVLNLNYVERIRKRDNISGAG